MIHMVLRVNELSGAAHDLGQLLPPPLVDMRHTADDQHHKSAKYQHRKPDDDCQRPQIVIRILSHRR